MRFATRMPRTPTLVSLALASLTAACGATHGGGDTGTPDPNVDASSVGLDALVPPGIDGGVPAGTDGAVDPSLDARSRPDTGSTMMSAAVGTPCDADEDCPGLFCSPAPVGLGYCSWLCSDAMPCPGEASCVMFDPAASYGYCMVPCEPGGAECPVDTRCQTGIASVPVCYPGCTTDDDCDPGQRCALGIGGVEQCYSPTAEAGQTCTDSRECPELGYCLDEETWGTPGGLCTTFCDLAGGMGCEAGTVCVAWGFMSGAGACIPTCDDTIPCRDGYQCVSTGEGRPRGCVARCESDAQCTGGRECNFVTGRCG